MINLNCSNKCPSIRVEVGPTVELITYKIHELNITKFKCLTVINLIVPAYNHKHMHVTRFLYGSSGSAGDRLQGVSNYFLSLSTCLAQTLS